MDGIYEIKCRMFDTVVAVKFARFDWKSNISNGRTQPAALTMELASYRLRSVYNLI